MLKNLTLLAVAGLLTNTGCIITSPTDTDSGTNITTTNNTTEGTTTDGTTTDDGTTALTSTTALTTTEGTTDGTTETPTTTGVPTTTDGTTTEGTTTEGTTGSGFGQCGWNADAAYYECDQEGADPDGISPIECPEELPAAGDACDGASPVNNVGCCLPDGTVYYCTDPDGGMIVIEECGA